MERKTKKFQKVWSAPGPPGLPFIGNLHQLDNSVLHRQLWQLSKKYGPIMSLRLGLVPTLVMSSARMAKEVFKTHDLAFSGRPSLLGQQKLSYNGIDMAFSPYNDSWRELRRIYVLDLFSPTREKSFLPIRQEEVSRMINKISKLANSSKLANLSEMLATFTSNIITRIALGKHYDDDGHETRRFLGIVRESQAVFMTFFISDYFSPLGWLDRSTRSYYRLKKNFKETDIFYQELIDEHLNPKRPKSTQEDIIDILLQLRKNQSSPFNLTMDHIKAVLVNILLGATETNTATIVWAMTELIRNPPFMKKAQEEVKQLIGKGVNVEEDDLEKLRYLKAAVKETTRLHPAGPLLLPRETTQSCVIDGYEIRPKTLVYVNAWAIGRDPEAWENPEKFLPERFLGDSAVGFRGHHFELVPFGAGRRRCPGMSMGAMTVELALANLLHSFDWELPTGIDKEDIGTEGKSSLVVNPKHDLCLVPKAFAEHVVY
ncbi:hypothetical protein RJ640_021963 [Escallonia rubra]|uniref:Cytochrome P450 n=1 Tax=Escallonia rubra TaxID=112253 RepID=A0AA88QUA0_9ASTE|nr:hypothetical protein RJ640_021963 [Escallonia rubra]